ncbi:MAG: hypothetical protein ACM34K_05885, partial [Bacillota bacterium]
MHKLRQCVTGFLVLIVFFLVTDIKAQFTQINQIGGFESDLPSYWMKGKETGATLSWATDQFRSMGRSLK